MKHYYFLLAEDNTGKSVKTEITREEAIDRLKYYHPHADSLVDEVSYAIVSLMNADALLIEED